MTDARLSVALKRLYLFWSACQATAERAICISLPHSTGCGRRAPLQLATCVIWERWSSVAFVSISDVFLVPKMLPSTCGTQVVLLGASPLLAHAPSWHTLCANGVDLP